ncbi:NEFA-interacting nuclear protein NIP30 [Macleaya cordata]|uniref:NEFA-interacting nuclear protein NIP30 n=1 Tax=Macleaya cordata TaxID=56857 RepID=A0A200R1R3_MACCD|nr:NEFA-interacting nuclear protein NIP30 [Macleaya cordata]
MAEEAPPPSFRLMNFVSEEQLDEAKKARGERADDGTAQRDKPLFEILKDNKDKRDAEFNERFKHRPPKALDEDETEFLDTLEMSKKEYEQQMADEEAQQLRSFQVAVAVHSSTVYELKETPSVPKVQEAKPLRRKNPPPNPLGGLIIKVKPQAKKAKTDDTSSGNPSDTVKTSNGDTTKSHSPDKGVLGGLVSYSDESEEEDDS